MRPNEEVRQHAVFGAPLQSILQKDFTRQKRRLTRNFENDKPKIGQLLIEPGLRRKARRNLGVDHCIDSQIVLRSK